MMRLRADRAGAGFEFVNEIVGGSVPREFIKPVEQGIQEAMERGVLAGYPMVDIKVDPVRRLVPRGRLLSEMAFKIAGSMAFKEARQEGRSVSSSRS